MTELHLQKCLRVGKEETKRKILKLGDGRENRGKAQIVFYNYRKGIS